MTAALASRSRNMLRYARELGIPAAALIGWQKLLKRPTIVVRAPGIPTPLYCRPMLGDLGILLEVFVGRTYEYEPKAEPEVIIDAGGNVGYSAVFFANRYPNARIISIEPDPANCELFLRNCSPYPNVRLVQGAIWHRAGWVSCGNPDAASSSFYMIEGSEGGEGLVPAVTLADLLREEGLKHIDILKLDIEGGERELFLNDSRTWLTRTRVILMELHDQYVEGCSRAFLSAVSGRDYRHAHRRGVDVVEFRDM